MKRRSGRRAAPPPLPPDCAEWVAKKRAEWTENPPKIQPSEDDLRDPRFVRWFMEKEAERKARDALWPYIVRGPDYAGEYDAHCPLHPDAHPSARINFSKGLWYCHARCGGGRIEDLMGWPEGWVPKDEHPAFAGRRS